MGRCNLRCVPSERLPPAAPDFFASDPLPAAFPAARQNKPMSASPRVLICDELDPRAAEVLVARGVEAVTRTGLDEAQLVDLANEFDGFVVRSATKIPASVLQAGTRLRAVGRAGIGTDNIDTAAATQAGVVVMNTPGGNTLSTAELALSLCLAQARHLPEADARVRAGGWDKKGLMGTEITGKTLGIVGLGRVGRLLAERALGLRMQVLAFDPHLPAGPAPDLPGVRVVAELQELLPAVDFLSLHVPLIDATRGLIGREALGLMRPTAYLVNTSRGGVVDEAALAVALDAGEIAGAALDVLEQEPPPAGHPLIGHPKILLTPHLGASSSEAQSRVAVMIAEQLADLLLDGRVQHAVNLPMGPESGGPEAMAALKLVECLGRFAAGAMQAPIAKVELALCGPMAERGADLLRLGALSGLLGPTMDTPVNLVNAPLFAEERGWRVLTASEEASVYQGGHIGLRVEAKDGTGVQLRGALFGDAPRIVRVDRVQVDLQPSGPFLLTRHNDRPGVLGAIGTVLGAHGINVRRVDLGRPSESEDALARAFLSLDSLPTSAALDELAALKPIQRLDAFEL